MSTAQHPDNQAPPTRRSFVFHVYVDPLRGDNGEARTCTPEPMAQNTVIAGITRSRFDNPTLFHSIGGTGSTSWGTMLLPPMCVRDGTINPPGTVLLSDLWTINPVVQFGLFAPCGGTTATTYDVGVWGFGDAPASCPDQVPGIPFGGGTQLLSAIRFNVEQLASETFPLGSNLQTFLGIRTPPPVINAGSRGAEEQRHTEARIQPMSRPTREAVEEMVRRAQEGRR